MGDSPIEVGEPPEYEEFGVHKLLLSSSNLSGYRDVQFLKNRKKKPWQAKVWRPWARDHINLGCFRSAQEAAVAVAVARAEGLEGQQSPDKSRAENKKRKNDAATPEDTTTPITFEGFENTRAQLPIAQAVPCAA